MIKIVTFFLIGMMILALLGRLRLPGRSRLRARRCPRCHRFLIGRGDCDCTAKRS